MKEKEVVKNVLDLSLMRLQGLKSLNGQAEDLESFGLRGKKIILEKICIKEDFESKVKPGKIKEIILASSIGRGLPVKALRETLSREGLRKKSTPKTSPVTDIKKSGEQIFVETTTSVYEVK